MLQNHQTLLTNHPIISDQIGKPALSVMLRELEYVLEQKIAGDIAEFGCYIGTTSVFIRRLMDLYQQSGERTFWAYDSFQGLPDKHQADASSVGSAFQSGELAVSKKQFLQTFHKTHLSPPRTVKAWFSDITPAQLPDQIAFAFLDGDFYESIYDSLKLVWPRMVRGGVVTIDDYSREALPGVERAVHDFFNGTPDNLHFAHHIGIIKKA